MSVSSAVLLKDQSKLRIPKITPVGEVWLFIDVAQVVSHTPEQIAEIVQSLGYTPELRIAEYFRDGRSHLEPVLLVHQGVLAANDELAPQKILGNWEQLAGQIQPSTAVHLRSGR